MGTFRIKYQNPDSHANGKIFTVKELDIYPDHYLISDGMSKNQRLSKKYCTPIDETAFENNINNFRNELRDLLEKYNAEIYVELDGDTHGVSDALVIDFGNVEIMRFDNSSVSHYDLK